MYQKPKISNNEENEKRFLEEIEEKTTRLKELEEEQNKR